MKQKVTAIVACTPGGGIGFNGKLPWPKIPGDLDYFKIKTVGKTVVMGRKTHESIGRALQGRRNIVVTRSPEIITGGIEIASSRDDVLSMTQGEDVFIIGGAEIYSMFLNDTDEIDMLVIGKHYDYDVSFPEYSYLFSIKDEYGVMYKNDEEEYISCNRLLLERKLLDTSNAYTIFPLRKNRGDFFYIKFTLIDTKQIKRYNWYIIESFCALVIFSTQP